VLCDEEIRVVQSLLSGAWDGDVHVRDAELIWDRRHIVRLKLDDDRTAVLKRRRPEQADIRVRGFGADLAALEFLTSMPVQVAPRLLGADTEIGILLMEDMGQGGSLADVLLGTDRLAAEAALVSYAQALAAIHAWGIGRAEEFGEIRARRAQGITPGPHWMDFIEEGKDALLKTAADLDLGALADDAAPEFDALAPCLNDPRFTALVHSDACPDNTQITDGTCRIFDFETSGWGPVAIDAAYLLLPFPSCWCFAQLPAEVSAQAMSAYRSAMSAAGISLGSTWNVALATALAALVTARGVALANAIGEDKTWGTTTVRPRVLTWLRGFTSFPASAEVTPRLHELAIELLERLEPQWASIRVPSYPALAMPGDVVATYPDSWD
jgi:Ser/Thr protein kinase RdoA (MazF antagonist)